MSDPKQSTYHPTPIDISQVDLPASLDDLVEQLAAHVHDTWAEERINQGWQYGPKRDDDQKRHPCLVPYHQLPDSEKEFDRKTALGTLKAIQALGYEIK